MFLVGASRLFGRASTPCPSNLAKLPGPFVDCRLRTRKSLESAVLSRPLTWRLHLSHARRLVEPSQRHADKDAAEPQRNHRRMAIRRKTFDWSTALITVCMMSAAVVVYVRDGWDRFAAVFFGDLHIFIDILPKMAAGCLIGVFSTLLIPRELVVRLVGAESGFAGLAIATFAGIIMPGGPVTVYPVAGAFLAAGADIGAALAFVTSWTLLGYARVLVWELPFFGADFVLWRMAVAPAFPLLVGLLGRFIAKALMAREKKP
jgi:hypothetical protein